MPNKNVHLPVARISGAAMAGLAATNEEPRIILARLIGGIIGGDIGGRMPDLIDPPSNPNHRSVGHAILPIFVLVKVGKPQLIEIRALLRNFAKDFEREERVVLSFLCELCIGLIDGFLAGYASHLVLDATTPAGLPLVK